MLLSPAPKPLVTSLGNGSRLRITSGMEQMLRDSRGIEIITRAFRRNESALYCTAASAEPPEAERIHHLNPISMTTKCQSPPSTFRIIISDTYSLNALLLTRVPAVTELVSGEFMARTDGDGEETVREEWNRCSSLICMQRNRYM